MRNSVRFKNIQGVLTLLLETIPYENNCPVEITVSNIREFPIHYHHDLEIIFLLKGSAILKTGCTTDTLSAGDVFTVSPHSVHGIRGLSDEDLFAVIHVNGDFLASHFPDSLPWTYHTKLDNRNDPDLGWLKEQLLQLISVYFRRTEGYLDMCTGLCQKIITLIDQRFVLFSIGDEEIRDLDISNRKSIERMLRVIRFIQENMTGPVSLATLAEQEGLSTFYLSHLIKDCTGLSFRDLVSFMRTEASELLLLENTTKISRIAKICGFSTSRYYEQAFRRWYHCAPEQHLATYRHMRLDVTNLPQVEFLPMDTLLDTLSQVAFQVVSQNRLVYAASPRPEVLRLDRHTQTIRRLECVPTVTLTLDDVKKMSAQIGTVMQNLSCFHVLLYQASADDPREIQALTKKLTDSRIAVTITTQSFVPLTRHYGYDTLAGPISLFLECIFNSNGQMVLPLRDPDTDEIPISGGNGLFTPTGAHKPLYDALFVMTGSPGRLKLRGRHYALVELDAPHDAYLLLTFNYNDEILRLCHEEGTPQAADEMIRNFREELNLRFRLELPPGDYTVCRYTYTYHSSLFHFLSEVNFSGPKQTGRALLNDNLFSPHAEGRQLSVEDTLDVDVTLRGLSLQIMSIRPGK